MRCLIYWNLPQTNCEIKFWICIRLVSKSTGVLSVPCCAWKCVPEAIYVCVYIFKVPGCHLLWQMSSQWDSQKLFQWLVSHELTVYFCVFDLFLTQRIMTTLSKGCKADNFESYNSSKINLTNIWGLHSNFIEWENFLESNSSDILVLWDKPWGIKWFWKFLCEMLYSFNPKGFWYSYASLKVGEVSEKP